MIDPIFIFNASMIFMHLVAPNLGFRCYNLPLIFEKSVHLVAPNLGLRRYDLPLIFEKLIGKHPIICCI